MLSGALLRFSRDTFNNLVHTVFSSTSETELLFSSFILQFVKNYDRLEGFFSEGGGLLSSELDEWVLRYEVVGSRPLYRAWSRFLRMFSLWEVTDGT